MILNAKLELEVAQRVRPPFSMTVWVRASLCGFQAGCLGSCRRVQISVWLFWVRAPVCGFQCGCLGTCSRVRISVRLFGFVPPCADFSVAVLVRSSLCGFQCGCLVSCPRVRSEVGGQAHRLGPSECFEPRWAGGLQRRALVSGFRSGCMGSGRGVRIGLRLAGSLSSRAASCLTV